MIACAQLDVPDQGGEACIVYIPTAISPNGDGINDHFSVQYVCSLDGYRLDIFDSMDRLIFQSENADATWDGTLEGEPMAEGYYTWRVTFEDPRTGLQVTQQGEFVLVR